MTFSLLWRFPAGEISRNQSHEVFSSLGFGFTWLISSRIMYATFLVNSLLPRSVFWACSFSAVQTHTYSKKYNSSYYRVNHLVWIGGFHSSNFVKYLVHKSFDKPNPAFLSPLFASFFWIPQTYLKPHFLSQRMWCLAVAPKNQTWEPSNSCCLEHASVDGYWFYNYIYI